MTEHDSNADDGTEPEANDRIQELEAAVETLAERVVELESGRTGRSDGSGPVSRRSVLGALGIAGLAGIGATTASADPQGQVGTQSDPLRALNVESIDTGLASTEFELSVGGSRALLLGQEEQTQSLAGPVVLGHSNNSASGPAATISGGGRGGGRNEATRNASVGGGNDNSATGNAATIAGGFGNEASGRQTAVGGGISHSATALQATIGGGNGNTASGDAATVGGGSDNEASADHATAGGGTSNRATAANATVGGGESNQASGEHAVVGGGEVNWAMAPNATVPGGVDNRATAANSFAAGTGAIAEHEGAFVWCDTSSGGLTSLNPNEFAVSAAGGTYFFSNEGATTGVELSSGSGSWSSASSRTLKSDVEPVASENVLEQVTDLQISRWSYDSQPDVRHMGPMAEEFHDAFGLGDDEEQISNVDADGVAFAAIQGLAERNEETSDRVEETAQQAEATSERVDELEAENEALRAELQELRAEIEFIQNAVVAADGGSSEASEPSAAGESSGPFDEGSM